MKKILKTIFLCIGLATALLLASCSNSIPEEESTNNTEEINDIDSARHCFGGGNTNGVGH